MRYLYICVFVFFNGLNAFAQKEQISLEQLKAPSGPAATIISIQPNEIASPKSARDFEAAILSNYLGDNNTLNVPDNFMLEAMPYWLGDRKNTNIVEYLEAKKSKALWHNFALSVASTQKYKIHDSINTNAFGFGARTLISSGEFKEDYKIFVQKVALNQTLQTFYAEVRAIISNNAIAIASAPTNADFMDNVYDNYKLVSLTYTGLAEGSKNEVESVKEILKKQLGTTPFVDRPTFLALLQPIIQNIRKHQFEELKANYEGFKTIRKGPQLEAAGALSLNFPTNNIAFSMIPQWGFWLTANFNLDPIEPKDGKLNENKLLQKNFLVMVRYLRNDLNYYNKYQTLTPAFYRNNMDIGSRLNFAAEKFLLGFEAISRYRTTLIEEIRNPDGTTTSTKNKDWEWKYTLNFNYAISPNVVLNYNIGKDINPTISVNGNIISTIGLNFGFGGPKVEAIY